MSNPELIVGPGYECHMVQVDAEVLAASMSSDFDDLYKSTKYLCSPLP